MLQRLLLVLPAAAVAVVAWVVLTAGAPRPVLGVQVLGGPPQGSAELSLLVRSIQSDGSRHEPAASVPLVIRARAAELSASWEGTTDRTGHAEVRLTFERPLLRDPELTITRGAAALVPAPELPPGQVLAQGKLSLDHESWQAAARRQGGWIGGQREGELVVRIGAATGVLAVPFASELLVHVTAAADSPSPPGNAPTKTDVGVAAARVELELDGAEALTSAGASTLTDASGRARVRVRPLEHAVAVRVVAHSPAGQTGFWYGVLPIVPGALSAELVEGRLRLASPIVRDHAFVSLVSSDARLAGAIVALTADDLGGASAELTLEPALLAQLEAAPSWAVISSEYDKRSPAVVGWPLPPPAITQPGQTFDVPDQLLLDGVGPALEAERRERRERRRLAAAILALIGVALAVTLWMRVRGSPGAAHRARASSADRDRIEGGFVHGPRRGSLAAAIACVLLAVLALAWFAIAPR